MTGVPPGLQNQCWALGASWVGSIPTCPRQKELFHVKKMAISFIEKNYKLQLKRMTGIYNICIKAENNRIKIKEEISERTE